MSNNEIEAPITLEECAAFLKKSKSTIYSWISSPSSSVPYHKKNNSIYFFKSELIKWLKDGE